MLRRAADPLVFLMPEIRSARPDDLPALTEIYNHYVRTSAITFDLEPVSLDSRREWLSHYAETGPHRVLVAVEGEDLLGWASSSRLRPKAGYDTTVETSVYLHPDHHGRGLGTFLYLELFQRLAGEDLHRAYAGVALPNPASIALHRKLGFRPLGIYEEVGRKFGRYWSVQWLEKALP